MRNNIGNGERAFRVVVGLAILGLYGALQPPMQYLTLVGLVPLGTGLTGFCPIVAAVRRRNSSPHAGGAR